jgi:hypothetical protein
MYSHLQTKVAAQSPLLGLLRIDQLAFLARSDEDEAAIKKQLRLSEANWVEDHVVAEGYVRGARNPGEPRGTRSSNTAKLLFNYDLGIELEILRYTEGMNYADVGSVASCALCHVGCHVEKGQELPGVLKDWTFGSPIIQQVETQSHTNEFLVQTGRKYRYTIYDTKGLLGVYFKVIERLEIAA